MHTIQYLGVVLFVVVVFGEGGGREGVEGHREEMGEQWPLCDQYTT